MRLGLYCTIEAMAMAKAFSGGPLFAGTRSITISTDKLFISDDCLIGCADEDRQLRFRLCSIGWETNARIMSEPSIRIVDAWNNPKGRHEGRAD